VAAADAQSGEYKNMVQAGIIDPTRVVRTALPAASSVAGLVITTEVMIASRPEKPAPATPGGFLGRALRPPGVLH
jgi:chaperonin GroEL